MKKIDKFVIGVMLYWIIFVVTMIVIFLIKEAVPDTLIQYGLGGGAVELACSAAIEIISNKRKKEGEG